MTGTSTARTSDLALLKGLAFVPVQWSQITAKDTILSRAGDGETRYVVKVENLGEHRVISAMHGEQRQVLTVRSDDPVHVLEWSTGDRYADYLGAPVVRHRRGVS